MSDGFSVVLPLGRIVQGHPMVYQTKGYKNKPLISTKGEPYVEFFFCVAIDKNLPTFHDLWSQICKFAVEKWPNGESITPTFSWKITDGDTGSTPGQPAKIGYTPGEGCAGHYMVKCKSRFAPKVFKKEGEGRWSPPITEKNQIKCGDYVHVSVTVKTNGDSDKPGVIVWFNAVELVGYGTEIAMGADPTALFGGIAPPAAIPGMTLIGTAVPGMVAPAPPGMAAPAPPGMAAPAAPGMAAPAPPGMVAPAVPGMVAPTVLGMAPPAVPGMAVPGMVPPAAAPAVPGLAVPGLAAPAVPGMAAPAVPGLAAPAVPGQHPDFLNPGYGVAGADVPLYTMAAAANGQTRAQMNALGWTDEMLITHGYMG